MMLMGNQNVSALELCDYVAMPNNMIKLMIFTGCIGAEDSRFFAVQIDDFCCLSKWKSWSFNKRLRHL